MRKLNTYRLNVLKDQLAMKEITIEEYTTAVQYIKSLVDVAL